MPSPPQTASTTDLRFNNSQGTEPTQNIAAAEYYIDTRTVAAGRGGPPHAGDRWRSFNAKTEGLTASVPTDGLSPGKHLLFVRAQDAAGNWGAFSATFLRVK